VVDHLRTHIHRRGPAGSGIPRIPADRVLHDAPPTCGSAADVLIGADGVRSTVRTLIDPNAPGANYTGLLGFGSYIDADIDLEPGTMPFAFGTRAYYLYWAIPGGRVAWGANLPSQKYLTLSQARAVPATDWLRALRETYAGDVPGGLFAERTTAESLEVLGALHIMPPVPRWHRGRMVLVGDAVHAPSNSTGQGASLAVESAIQLARCLRDLPDASSAVGAHEALRRARVEKITKRGGQINQVKNSGAGGAEDDAADQAAHVQGHDPEKSLSWDSVTPSTGKSRRRNQGR